MSWWGLGESLALAAQGFEAVLRGFFHKELPSLLRVFHGCFLPARFPSCLQVKECFRTAARSRRPKKRHFPELAPHDSSIIHPQAQEPSREFSWLSQWRRTDGRLFPSDNPPHLPACFFLSRPPSPQDPWTRSRVHTDNFYFLSISDKTKAWGSSHLSAAIRGTSVA